MRIGKDVELRPVDMPHRGKFRMPNVQIEPINHEDISHPLDGSVYDIASCRTRHSLEPGNTIYLHHNLRSGAPLAWTNMLRDE